MRKGGDFSATTFRVGGWAHDCTPMLTIVQDNTWELNFWQHKYCSFPHLNWKHLYGLTEAEMNWSQSSNLLEFIFAGDLQKLHAKEKKLSVRLLTLVLSVLWLTVFWRYAAYWQGLQLSLPLPAGGVEDHPSGQPEEHQDHPWRAPLPRHRSHSWTGERGQGLPESSVLLGEEADPLRPWKATSSAGWHRSQKLSVTWLMKIKTCCNLSCWE